MNRDKQRGKIERVVSNIIEADSAAEAGELIPEKVINIVEEARDNFPFSGYREYQEEILLEAAIALFVEEYDTVMIDGPTGIGKSAINMALGKIAENAFYTTPQKKLRNQLQNDGDLKEYHSALRARQDYSCDSVPPKFTDGNRSYNCEDCPVRVRGEESCRERGCSYWGAKESTMEAAIATLTFAFLIIDNRVPSHTLTQSDGEVQISFDDREVLVIDEAHTLGEQVASLHAGSTLTNYTLKTREPAYYDINAVGRGDVPENVQKSDVDPYEVFNREMQNIMADEKPWIEVDDLTIEDIKPAIKKVNSAISRKLDVLSVLDLNEDGGKVQSNLESLAWKLKMVLDDIEEDRPWVISGGTVDENEGEYEVSLKPVYVDRFLENNVWSRAEKVILSTATLPFRDNPKKWAERIGREREDVKVISKPMPFPAENRQVRLDYAIGSMSGGGIDDHWDEIVSTLRDISRKHSGQKGLIHTVSYARAERLHEALPNLTMYHDPDSMLSSAGVIEKWQRSDKQMLLTPSMMEGVDLHDDLCRFQALMKVPYKNIKDSRVDYLLNEEGDWEWYHDTAARKIIQSIGRAVRSPEDYATYYVLDSKFDQAMSGRTPEWLEDAIVR